MDANEIANKMAEALKIEDEFLPTEVKEFTVKGGKGYYVDRGTVEFSRGTTIEAYVYIEYPDGETVAEKLTTPGELELWINHLA